jgi:predicted nucleic acid-binding protein
LDPDDDYLIALASEQSAVLVTGDRHLLATAGRFPILEPANFLAMLARSVT